MERIKKIIGLSLFLFAVSLSSQTLNVTQQQNARATGYAIVAARNPGKSFSIYMVKWDGIHDLEYNANNQINSLWHAQAAIKGNYFDQTFIGSDFTYYSSVVVSQSEFDTYKNTGSDWWIVCSTLPSYSNSSFFVSDNGNVGLGINAPLAKLHVNNGDNSYGTILANASEANFSLYAKTLTTQPINTESFRFGLKHGVDENNGFISFL
jgi:hypothetical protein